jgi:outer membrane protein
MGLFQFKKQILETEMTSISKIALACAALVAASGAFAQKAGDNIASIGFATIRPSTSTGPITTTSTGDSNQTGAGLTSYLGGTSAHLSNENTISFGLLHMFTDNVGAEFTIGIPPRVTQDLTTPNLPAQMGGANHPGAAKIDVWTPTAIAKYFFGTTQDTWRPYAGLGVSRVSFHNISTLNDGGTIQSLAGNGANLTSSWAPVYNVGMIYNINDKWSINGSASYISAKTTATFLGTSSQGVPLTTTGDIKINTMDYVIRLGYKF